MYEELYNSIWSQKKVIISKNLWKDILETNFFENILSLFNPLQIFISNIFS